MNEYDVVRVVALDGPPREYTGTDGVMRAPKVGDTGIIVHVNDDGAYIVEEVDASGNCIWLADFQPHELELVERPAG